MANTETSELPIPVLPNKYNEVFIVIFVENVNTVFAEYLDYFHSISDVEARLSLMYKVSNNLIGSLQPMSRDTDNNAAMYNCWWTNKRS